MRKTKTRMIDGEIWYDAKDVCYALGYTNPYCVLKNTVEVEDSKMKEYLINNRGLDAILSRTKPELREEYIRMMNEERVSNGLTVFENEEFGKVRMIEENGKILFCGLDVAKALGYSVPRKALFDHCRGVLKRNAPTNGGVQEMSFITEGDMYRLIVHSKLPSAEKFESWVFDDVLPSIRKHGMYATDEILSDPDLLEAQAKKLREEREQKLNEENGRLLDENKRLAAMATSYETKLFIRDHIKDIFDFINKCVRSYAAISKGGKIGYGWKDYYDQLTEELGVDIRERGKPYIDQITDEEMGAAIRVAGKISVRPVNTIVSDELIELMKDIVRRAA